mgnify:CR=1 FL=1|tara:strand:+ start:384 stop:1172 length:789 start_codon:yes stop_codon:yes gene_type:complete
MLNNGVGTDIPSEFRRRFPQLFNNNEEGVLFDPSVSASLFSSTDTSTIAGPGDPVALMLDLSGNGNNATQPVLDSRPILQTDGVLSWLEFDGVNDFMSTGNIDFTNTSDMSVFVGVLNQPDELLSVIVELPLTPVIDPAFGLFVSVPPGGQYGFSVQGTTSVLATTPVGSSNAPSKNVLSASYNSQTNNASLKVNDLVEVTDTLTIGGGNFSNKPLFVGSRDGSTLFFDGNMYGLAVTGKATAPGQRGRTERAMGRRTGVTI